MSQGAFPGGREGAGIGSSERNLRVCALADQIAGAFRRQLQSSDFPVDQDFFATGGASIVAAMCVADLRRSGTPLSINDVFVGRTPRKIAERVVDSESGA